jgi:hypothetical protein
MIQLLQSVLKSGSKVGAIAILSLSLFLPVATSGTAQAKPAPKNPPNSSTETSEKLTEQTSQDSIDRVLAARLMQNSPDGKFYAERALSRAEIATILVKAFSLDRLRSLKTSAEFIDVPTSYWAYQAIKTAVSAGVTIGYEKNRFFPNQRVTRAEGFATFANAYGIFQFPEDTIKEFLAPYPDSKELPAWARKAWATALNEGFVNLDSDSKINSLKPMTRGDMAFALSKYLEKERGRSGNPPKY